MTEAQLADMAARESSPTVRRIFGPTILLNSGNYFDLLRPHDSVFTIEDVAHGLSNVCRFAGQCDQFYSVAEHSYHVSFLVPPEDAFQGLMHDATEAFIGDVTKPLKDILPEYRVIERHIEAEVCARFAVTLPLPDSVKLADTQMLVAEQMVLMRNADAWYATRGAGPADVALHCWSPAEAKMNFLRRYTQLAPAT